ncbi:MAG: hypothetical protein OEW12_04885 [Deltaproteobacteria bacterium]|nr:hypothetical protein [Deltaproteobacteria bacterium]
MTEKNIQIVNIPCPKCGKKHKITTARYVSKRPINCDCGTEILVDGDMSRVKTKKVGSEFSKWNK